MGDELRIGQSVPVIHHCERIRGLLRMLQEQANQVRAIAILIRVIPYALLGDPILFTAAMTDDGAAISRSKRIARGKRSVSRRSGGHKEPFG
ncbi:hypothetical protein [Brevibacterium paucivorans]|uniref:hypothetical protein n=1 Tax=Brevibacterium paucivorans TaxID=170994 RepID=UPI000306CB1A|nr:hypothetical protein [Brevibacterium paucivorans]WJY88631.1 hypothetical protein CCONF_00295 [Corynebacterium confusum]SNV94521.1 Uncharacterised protein [Corynebacterium urealyticum]VDG62003.1 Uncharacterised protein [Streptococcus thermophilus]